MAALHQPLITTIALLLVAAVIALVAWALQLMQAATDRQEFSLMLAGCMVCCSAVGLATVMVITLTGPRPLLAGAPPLDAGVTLDAVLLPDTLTWPDGGWVSLDADLPAR
ncbi:hypothetical protein [Cyanobium sp. CH-040]|uniref:hypothetical protein n=1 Tax=Cyanobium sp. CH-040 TaxID=2823708 RepID=UPI0020CFAF1F|nr:hypothetical protein [Cyanobium sp. CH-040]MCP9926385.1 hypothetical protein [Cyanobium sp. CH-040]